jgi:hypothetical protein
MAMSILWDTYTTLTASKIQEQTKYGLGCTYGGQFRDHGIGCVIVNREIASAPALTQL